MTPSPRNNQEKASLVIFPDHLEVQGVPIKGPGFIQIQHVEIEMAKR